MRRPGYAMWTCERLPVRIQNSKMVESANRWSQGRDESRDTGEQRKPIQTARVAAGEVLDPADKSRSDGTAHIAAVAAQGAAADGRRTAAVDVYAAAMAAPADIYDLDVIQYQVSTGQDFEDVAGVANALGEGRAVAIDGQASRDSIERSDAEGVKIGIENRQHATGVHLRDRTGDGDSASGCSAVCSRECEQAWRGVGGGDRADAQQAGRELG